MHSCYQSKYLRQKVKCGYIDDTKIHVLNVSKRFIVVGHLIDSFEYIFSHQCSNCQVVDVKVAEIMCCRFSPGCVNKD